MVRFKYKDNVLSVDFGANPPYHSINTPSKVAHPFSLGRVVFSFINAGMSFFLFSVLVGILVFKEIIVYENNLFILGFEILLAIGMFILNFKEGIET